jgi:ABC-2 type transport system permease protein
MILRAYLSVLWASARLGAKSASGEGLAYLGRLGLLAVILLAYGGVYRGVPAGELAAHGLNAETMIWYLSATELFLFCGSIYFKDLQADIWADAIGMELMRPVPMWVVRVGHWFGEYLCRLCILSLPTALMTGWIAGDLTRIPAYLGGLLLFYPMGAFIYLAVHFMIAVGCLWTKQADPLFWIYQKMLFLLGALLWPLALYPEAFRLVVWITPFPAMLAAGGTSVLTPSFHEVVFVLAHQFLWLMLVLKTVAVVNKAVLHRFQRRGG